MKYPIGIQDFETIREDGYAYVDKTAWVYKLVKEGKVYFLSRPRRFGKSLLVSTLDYYFRGRKDLFQGLAIDRLESEWTSYPVFRIDFSSNAFHDGKALRDYVAAVVQSWEKAYGYMGNDGYDSGKRFAELLAHIHRTTGKRCVVLIDEYDKHLMFGKVSYISENRNVIPTWAQKASQNAGVTLGFYFHETNNDFVRASAHDREISLDYIGMKLQVTHPKGKPTRYTIIPNDGRHEPIDLRDASSGVQTSASVALIVKDYARGDGFSFKDAFKRSVLNYLYDMERLNKFKAVMEPGDLSKKVYIHIEEPELSLFPNAQCKLIEEIILAAAHAEENRELHLMLATHSPYILNYLNVLLNQTNPARAQLSRANTAVYRIYEGEAQDLLVQNERGRWIVDTYDLSELMGHIYNEFVALDV